MHFKGHIKTSPHHGLSSAWLSVHKFSTAYGRTEIMLNMHLKEEKKKTQNKRQHDIIYV